MTEQSTEATCEHDWHVTKTWIVGDYRHRRYECRNCNAVDIRTIPLEYAPRQKYRGKRSMRRIDSVEINDKAPTLE